MNLDTNINLMIATKILYDAVSPNSSLAYWDCDWRHRNKEWKGRYMRNIVRVYYKPIMKVLFRNKELSRRFLDEGQRTTLFRLSFSEFGFGYR